MAITTCFSLVACGDGNGDTDASTGMAIRKSAGAYIVKDYVKEVDANGATVTELVISGETVATAYGTTYADEEISISENAFKGNTSIKKLTVTSDVVKIGKGAFAGMTALEELVLPFAGSKIGAVNEERLIGYLFGSEAYDEGISVTQTVSGDLGVAGETPTTATYYMPISLKTIEIKYEGSEDYVLPQYTFSGIYSALRTVKLSGNITEIGTGAFYGSSVKNITLPETVTKIGNDAFNNCALLTAIALHEGITELGDRAFKGFKGTTMLFPNSLTKIGAECFIESELKKINRELDTFAEIGKWAFEGLTLEKI